MKKCELLVPAGGSKQFIAAVENGADAVYIGGPLYNARIGAENFSLDEMRKAVDYAHLRNVKVYATLNTLISDEELDSAVGFAENLYEMGADALIIQDLGLGKRIKERMPDFPLHLSTQATVYNRRGLEAAAKLGYERAVLARELSLEEIKECSLPPIIETEVFVHGALCICYSGQCQMSRFIGGRSGNRGCCAQPCRLPYIYEDLQGKRVEKAAYPLSPKDLCMIDRLGELIESGVASLKIEGRMKSPEYVATVTRIYRKYLDKYYAYGQYKVSSEDMEELTQIFNRGGFTEGYADGEIGDELMSGLLPKNQGIKVGEISELCRGGMLADVRLSGRLEMGDVVEIHSKESFGMKITYLEEIGKNKVRIGDLKGKAFAGDSVYRMISQSLMKKASETFNNISFDSGKFKRKAPVSFVFRADVGGAMHLHAKCTGPDGQKIEIHKKLEDFVTQQAITRSTTEEEVIAQLRKTGNTPFEATNIKVLLGGQVYIPISKVNEIRRLTLEELSEAKAAHYRRSPNYAEHPAESEPDCKDKGGYYSEVAGNCQGSEMAGLETNTKDVRFAELFFDSWMEYQNCGFDDLIKKLEKIGVKKNQIRILLPLRELADNMVSALMLAEEAELQGFKLIPYISNLTKGPYDLWIEDNLSVLSEFIRNIGNMVYIGNIGWIEPFASCGIKVLGDYGLNIYNLETESAYKSLGMYCGTPSLEAMEQSMGSFPLMVTEHPMGDGVLLDRKGAAYLVKFDEKNHKTTIRSKEENMDWQRLEDLWCKTEKSFRIYI